MSDVVFVTSNQGKVKYLTECLGYPVDHTKLELDEVQSLNYKEIVKHKLYQAHRALNRPVLVEDTSLEFKALGGLPGPFIRWFEDALTFEGLCRLVDGKDRAATARCVYGYFDGENEQYFEGSIDGRVAEKPAGSNGYGFDCIFIPDGYEQTRAEFEDEEYRKTYLKYKPLEAVKRFLETR